MQTITGKLRGITALLMHNARLADPLDPYTIRLKAATVAKKTKGSDPEVAMQRVAQAEWEGGLYWDSILGPYIPSSNLFSAIQIGARLAKGGKNIERGLTFNAHGFRLDYVGPRDRKGLWLATEDSDVDGEVSDAPTSFQKFVDRRSVVVARARVMRTRPRFSEWSINFSAVLNTDVLAATDVQKYIEDTGLMVGLCDARSRGQGKFVLENFKVT